MEIDQITGLMVDSAMKVHFALGPGLEEDAVIVELKVVEHIFDIHKAQLLSYLKLRGKHVGLVINFNVVHLRDGIRRMVNGARPSESFESPASSVAFS
jgi:hypothetical protein